jgi:ATP-dependent Clp protease protease subunit
MMVRQESCKPNGNGSRIIASKYEDFEILEEHCLDIKNRTIYLVGDIVDGIVEGVVQQINYLSSPIHCGQHSTKPIIMVINSLGGHDDMMLYLYDTMVNCPCKIHTVGTGLVCSAATLLLVAGDKSFATENCMFMTHKGKSSLAGDEDEITAQAEFNLKMNDRYWKLMGRHTFISGQKWYTKSKSAGENWLDTNDMIKAGVIEGVIPSPRELKALPVRRIKTKIKMVEEVIEEDVDDDDDAEE